jgi:hypothetical protein
MLRADIHAKLRCGEILIDSASPDGYQETKVDCITSETVANGGFLDGIPSLDWVGGHLSPAAGTAASTLQCIAANACGLSGRNLRGLLDVALFTYFVDEAPYLSEALVALERVVQKEARQAESCGDKSVEIIAQQKHIGQDEDVELPASNNRVCSRLTLPIDTNVYSSDY